ncbi:hypothetical protein [Streptomyces asiaticus]|uniref:hypothetical protein n=1 Tax=Streptomyces asiaticus TaxID=114695 RepID=UPI0031E1227D
MIAVQDLAGLMVATALAPVSALTASIYHAAHPTPATANAILRAVADCTETPWPQRELTVEQARAILAEYGRSRAVLDMLTTDHFFDSGPLWSDLSRDPGDGFDITFRRAAHWYRKTLRAA